MIVLILYNRSQGVTGDLPRLNLTLYYLSAGLQIGNGWGGNFPLGWVAKHLKKEFRKILYTAVRLIRRVWLEKRLVF
jgi:hypothetical protein